MVRMPAASDEPTAQLGVDWITGLHLYFQGTMLAELAAGGYPGGAFHDKLAGRSVELRKQGRDLLGRAAGDAGAAVVASRAEWLYDVANGRRPDAAERDRIAVDARAATARFLSPERVRPRPAMVWDQVDGDLVGIERILERRGIPPRGSVALRMLVEATQRTGPDSLWANADRLRTELTDVAQLTDTLAGHVAAGGPIPGSAVVGVRRLDEAIIVGAAKRAGAWTAARLDRLAARDGLREKWVPESALPAPTRVPVEVDSRSRMGELPPPRGTSQGPQTVNSATPVPGARAAAIGMTPLVRSLKAKSATGLPVSPSGINRGPVVLRDPPGPAPGAPDGPRREGPADGLGLDS